MSEERRLTIVQERIEAAAQAVAALQALEVTVLRVSCAGNLPHALIHVADPGARLDHAEAQRLDTRPGRFFERSVTLHGCEAFWLIERPEARAA